MDKGKFVLAAESEIFERYAEALQSKVILGEIGVKEINNSLPWV
jgi:hypothetical protein